MGFQVYNSQGQELQNLTGTAGGDLTGTYPNPTIAASALRTTAVFHVRDEKTQNTQGGTFTSGAWQTRTLNTSVVNTITNASLASNKVTLPAGTYWVTARAPAYSVGAHIIRVRNVTDSTDIIIGTGEYSPSGGTISHSFATGSFTLAASKDIEIQHRCFTTVSSNGFGAATNFATEIYAEAVFWKV